MKRSNLRKIMWVLVGANIGIAALNIYHSKAYGSATMSVFCAAYMTYVLVKKK